MKQSEVGHENELSTWEKIPRSQIKGSNAKEPQSITAHQSRQASNTILPKDTNYQSLTDDEVEDEEKSEESIPENIQSEDIGFKEETKDFKNNIQNLTVFHHDDFLKEKLNLILEIFAQSQETTIKQDDFDRNDSIMEEKKEDLHAWLPESLKDNEKLIPENLSPIFHKLLETSQKVGELSKTW